MHTDSKSGPNFSAGLFLVVDRAATVVGIPKISRYTDFFQNSVFLEAKGGALLNVQKFVKLGKTWQT